VPTVSVIDSTTLPLAPAVKAIAFVPCPLLIVPLVIVQAYVTPPCAATLAFAAAFAQTFGGALITGDGGTLIGIVALPFVVHPPFVTLTLTVTLPLAPAVKVIAFVPAPAVIVPLVIDHAYVVAPAGPLAWLPVEFAHTCAGAGVMVGVDGLALMGTLTVVCAEQLAPLVTVRVRSTMPEAPAV
jgi:hypothetical protein